MKTKIDRAYLRNLLGSDAATAQFIALFKAESAQLAQDILRFLEEGDFKSLSIAAHGLKSHLRYVNIKDLAEIAQNIEYACEQNKRTPELEKWILELTDKIKEIN